MPIASAVPNVAVPNRLVPDGAGSAPIPALVAYRGLSVLRARRRPAPPRRRGRVRTTAAWLPALEPAEGFHVYGNDSSGAPIDYGTIVATVAGVTWTSGTLAAPGTWRFGVRAYDGNGEEQNLDAAVTIVLDAEGNDITNVPAPPTGLRAFATAGGGIRVEWWYAPVVGAKAPTGFHVYSGTGGSPSYTSPVATVLYTAAIKNAFVANLSGLTGGTAYTIGVRGYNAHGEESNTQAVTTTADTTGPAAVSSLTATAVT